MMMSFNLLQREDNDLL